MAAIKTEAIETEETETGAIEAGAIKTEDIKTEPIKTEPISTEPIKTEPIKIEAIKTEAIKAEATKTEATKTDATKTEAAKTYKFFILTGKPGVGKTTLIKKLTKEMEGKHIKTTGFYTEEVRLNQNRDGFDVQALEGTRGRLARDVALLDGRTKYKVGKYGVLVQEFENVVLPTLVKPNTSRHLVVIDEIGKMELYSDAFKIAIRSIFVEDSKYKILATIPVTSNDYLIESIRKHREAKVWMVTYENRDSIYDEILKEINAVLNFM